MSKQDDIRQIIGSLDNSYIVDQEKVTDLMLKSKVKVFLDTCFVSKLKHMGNKEIIDGLNIYADENSVKKDDIIFVITSMILYEMKEGEKNHIDPYIDSIIHDVCDNDYKVVILMEEEISKQLRQYVGVSGNSENVEFVSMMRLSSVYLTRLSIRIKDDKTLTYQGILETGGPVPKDNTFIENFLLEIKELKMNKDSLAEELIAISILMYARIWNIQKRGKQIVFCTNDYDAAMRVHACLKAGLSAENISFKKIYAFTFGQYLIEKGIITDLQYAKESLIKMVGSQILIFEDEEPPYGSFEIQVETGDMVEKIFNGDKVAFCAKNLSGR